MSRRRWGDPLAKTSGRRQARVNDLLRREMGTILQRYYTDKLSAMVTVTEVRTSGDLRHAKVYVSILAEKEEQDAVIKRLQHLRPELRQHLMDRVILKFIPSLDMCIDDSAEHARRIEELLAQSGTPEEE